jgi:hypothetical protein
MSDPEAPALKDVEVPDDETAVAGKYAKFLGKRIEHTSLEIYRNLWGALTEGKLTKPTAVQDALLQKAFEPALTATLALRLPLYEKLLSKEYSADELHAVLEWEMSPLGEKHAKVSLEFTEIASEVNENPGLTQKNQVFGMQLLKIASLEGDSFSWAGHGIDSRTAYAKMVNRMDNDGDGIIRYKEEFLTEMVGNTA